MKRRAQRVRATGDVEGSTGRRGTVGRLDPRAHRLRQAVLGRPAQPLSRRVVRGARHGPLQVGGEPHVSPGRDGPTAARTSPAPRAGTSKTFTETPLTASQSNRTRPAGPTGRSVCCRNERAGQRTADPAERARRPRREILDNVGASVNSERQFDHLGSPDGAPNQGTGAIHDLQPLRIVALPPQARAAPGTMIRLDEVGAAPAWFERRHPKEKQKRRTNMSKQAHRTRPLVVVGLTGIVLLGVPAQALAQVAASGVGRRGMAGRGATVADAGTPPGPQGTPDAASAQTSTDDLRQGSEQFAYNPPPACGSSVTCPPPVHPGPPKHATGP